MAVAALAVGAGMWLVLRSSDPHVRYRLAKIERGDLLLTVTATGTIQPVTQVQVGTQVTGTIQKLFVDFNSIVKAGQQVAQIDPAPSKARVAQDLANYNRARADVDRVRANLVQAQKELSRQRELSKSGLVSASELDVVLANYDSLAAQVKVAESGVEQAKATLDNSEINLGYTSIVAPIDGVVVSRNVDVGQTVAASLQAPTLLVIAETLKHVQVQANVAEADIGRIRADQMVSFTVDAHRELRFSGRVFQVRLAPTTVQNVVTYTVIVNAENRDEKLLPGMTATVTFEIERHVGVLKVPNAALRFTPPGEGPIPRRIWTLRAGRPAPVDVAPGQTDGSWTAIETNELREGDEVVTGVQDTGAATSVTNPFTPRLPGRPR